MEIIVCLKQVPDTTMVEVDEKTGVLKEKGRAQK
jgi:electron transfer flavoprotein alpha/beta subunit